MRSTGLLILSIVATAFGARAQMGLSAGTSMHIEAGTSLRLDGPWTWTVPSGAAVINDGTVHLDPNASLNEGAGAAFTGAGTERIDRNYNAQLAGQEPGGLGLTLTTAIAPNALSVTRGHVPYTDYSGHASIARWFRAQSGTTTGLNATAMIRYDPTELNGLQGSLLVLHRYREDDIWDFLPGSVDIGAHTVQSSGLDSLGTLTAFEGQLPNPVRSIASASTPYLANDQVMGAILVLPIGSRAGVASVHSASGALVRSVSIAYRDRVVLDSPSLLPGVYLVRLDDGVTLPFIR